MNLEELKDLKVGDLIIYEDDGSVFYAEVVKLDEGSWVYIADRYLYSYEDINHILETDFRINKRIIKEYFSGVSFEEYQDKFPEYFL